MQIYFKTRDGQGSLVAPALEEWDAETARTIAAERMSLDPADVEVSKDPYPENLDMADIERAMLALQARLVGTEAADLWPVKLTAANAVLAGGKDATDAGNLLEKLLTPAELKSAKNKKAALKSLAEKIVAKHTNSVALRFSLEGAVRRARQANENSELNLQELQLELHSAMDELRAAEYQLNNPSTEAVPTKD